MCEPRQLSRYSDSLREGRYGDRIPVGSRSSAPVQTGPRPDPASCTRRTGSLPGVRRPGRGADHPPPSSAEVKEIEELYICSSMGLYGSLYGEPNLWWAVVNTVMNLTVHKMGEFLD